MKYKEQAKKMLRGIYRFNRGAYRMFFANPVVMIKKRHCAAINDFSFCMSFDYKPDSYYPAILKTGEKKTNKIYRRIVDFDKNDIPVVKGFEQRYWPVTIAQYGLLNYNFYLTHGNEKNKKIFQNVCDWLVQNIADSGAWEHHIVYHSTVVNEDLLPPYASAMVQGEAISVLVRGYHLFGNSDYLDCAAKALKPYSIPATEGGVLETFCGMPFYEEYPTKTPSLVLNGFIFSLFGLYDLSNTNHKSAELAKELFEKGTATLVKLLPLYDGGFCSRYDLSYITAPPRNKNMNPFYHAIHVNQLVAMNSIIHSDILSYYIAEWR